MIRALRRDAIHYRGFGGFLLNLGFWVVATYRFGSWARELRFRPLRFALLALAWTIKQPLRLALHVDIPFAARIGEGFALIHPFNVLIGPGAQIGADCAFYHEVTVGLGPRPGFPRVGSGIVVFPGARILGGISVGDRSEIGANCVLTHDVPASSIVVTSPARILPKQLTRVGDPPSRIEAS